MAGPALRPVDQILRDLKKAQLDQHNATLRIRRYEEELRRQREVLAA